MKKIVIANHKSNLLKSDIINYINEINNNNFTNLDLVFCPSNIYLNSFINGGLKTGSQDVSIFNRGSYTGEVNAEQLCSLGVEYSIVGHSERRKYFNDDSHLAGKLANLIRLDIKPILCIGESLEDRKSGSVEKVLEKQLDDAFIKINNIDINKIIVAYEPIWSIGTNKIPTSKEIEEVVNHIEKYVYFKYDASVVVIYGGSVNLDNITEINSTPNLKGYLVGTSSIDVNYYIELLKKIDLESENYF
jgi:triosephosphate isomerase